MDKHLAELIQKYKNITDQKYARIITRFNRPLTHPQRNSETSLGNLFADIFQESLGVDIMLLGSGSIRVDSLGPIVEYGSLIEAFPYDDGIYAFRVTGKTFQKMMTHVLREEAFLGTTEFYQLSKGLHLVYSRGEKRFYHMAYQGKEITDEDVFYLGLQSFHYHNLENFLGITYQEAKALDKARIISTSCLDILEEYLCSRCSIQQDVEGRITIVP